MHGIIHLCMDKITMHNARHVCMKQDTYVWSKTPMHSAKYLCMEQVTDARSKTPIRGAPVDEVRHPCMEQST